MTSWCAALCAVVAFVACGLVVPCPPSAAAGVSTNADQANLVVDVSSSMGESDGSGSSRISTVSEAIRRVVGSAPSRAQLGLTTYGGSCTAADSVVPLGRIDRYRAGWSIGSVQSGDDTPTALALRTADRGFATTGRKTIVLVSDGSETCGDDPAAVAQQLVRHDHSLSIDVVGVQVDNAAQQQLVGIAKAAGGRYYQATDGAALLTLLSRAGSRALQPYRLRDAPVTGTQDRASAPLLKPGSYVDELAPNQGSAKPEHWYSVNFPAGTTGYFAATLPVARRPDANTTPRLGASLYSGDHQCDSAQGYQLFEGGSTQVTVSLTYPLRRATGSGCGAPGTYWLKIDNSFDDVRTAPVPMELLAVIEPGITNRADLPPAERASTTAAKPQADGAPRGIVGSNSYSDAPVIGPGNYRDSLRSGERVVYRVKVGFGQRLAASLRLPRLSNDQDQRLGPGTVAELDLENPLRVDAGGDAGPQSDFYDGSRLTIGNSTVHVQYRNRESHDPQIQASCLAGYYYLILYLGPDVNDPFFDFTVDFSVDVQGDIGGMPDYRTTATLRDPQAQLPISVPGPPNVLPSGSHGISWLALLGVFLGAVLLVGGGFAGAAAASALQRDRGQH